MRQRPPWRSGARRPDSSAGREPKGARSGIQVLSEDLLIGFQSRQLHHATPRHATPRHATPRHATPRHATPRHATPRHATPRHATPRHATPRHATPRHATQDRIRDNLPSQCLSSASLRAYIWAVGGSAAGAGLAVRQPEGMAGFSRANRRRLCPARIIYFPSP
ncbi:Uncharacterised protein [Enterobacter hormaechei]|nr:Uncharacterised protein [Enterobacter hormaechei]